MRKIIHDCDNTFGIQGCDVDDGLALLYLLGDPDAEVLGVTTTYGNNEIDRVYPNTLKMLEEIGRTDIPVYKGGAHAGSYDSGAARFLAEMAGQYAGELEILATGSLTNLYGAAKYNPEFFRQVKKFSLMGGITEPLIFRKRKMDELNFSCDPKAAYEVLTGGADVAVITGNNCLKVLFTRDEYKEMLPDSAGGTARYIRTRTDYWFDDNMDDYGIPGFYNWDVVAAAYLMHPELFHIYKADMDISEDALRTGKLTAAGEAGKKNCTLEIPEIGGEEAFRKNIYQTWLNVCM